MLLYRSSDLDHLVDRLCHVLDEDGPGLLESEVVLIQSAGMERWLSREIAKRRGIAANLSFPFPRAFLRGVLEASLGTEPGAARYESPSLVWELFALLGQVKALPGYEIVARNIAGDSDGSRQFQLARELADLFDQYLTYRPQMMLDWEAGKDNGDFQADLFRRLVGRLGAFHFAQRFRRFVHDVTDEQLKSCLPCRLSLIGGPGLPPAYLRILSRVGELIPVHIFSFQVCGEYFADLHPDGELLPELGAGAHPLLVSFGKVGADFQTLVEQQGGYVDADAFFPKREAGTLLAHLQNDIQSGNRREVEQALPAASLHLDQSLTLDACHSPLREVEVLADRLLSWFAEDPSLRPEDVVVLSPDIEAYSPLISAVFGARGNAGPGLPFRISDRCEGAFNPAAKALLLGLGLFSGRLKASAVLDFMQLDPVQARFGISPVDLERISDWVRKVGIRWGADDEHLRSYGIANDGVHTLSWGLRRLLLGYACADEGDALCLGLVPEDDVPSGDAELLGRFAELTLRLLHFRSQALSGARTPTEWTSFVLEFFSAFIGESPGAHWDPLIVRQVIVDFAHGVKAADITEPLGLAPVTEALAAQLEARRSGTDFLSGGITFCALLPLRTIPFRRICVLGLDQGQFPRADKPSSLSWLERSPRPGDRSLRADDRFLFLELLLAARERLSLSYVGRSVQDNTECPASVVVTELSDVLRSMVVGERAEPGGAPGASGRGLSVRIHPLQPFSPRYFAGKPGLCSFDGRAFAGARELVERENGRNRGISPFVDACLLPWDSSGAIELSIEELVRFYKNPARAFLAGLEVRIDDEIEQFEDREPTSSDPLTRFGLGDELVQRGLLEQPVFEEVQLARGVLPPGSAGRAIFSEIERDASDILSDAKRVLQPDQLRARRIELSLDCPLRPGRTARVVLSGRLEVCGSYHVRASYGVADAKRRLAVWIEHLALCAAGEAVHSVLIGRAPRTSSPSAKSEPNGQSLCFEPLPRSVAEGELATLALGYLRGLQAPLCFFPAASLAFAEPYVPGDKSGGLSPAERAAAAFAWAERAIGRPGKEALIPSEVEQAFRGKRLLGGLSAEERAEFAQWAQRIFLPLLAHQSVLAGVEGEA